MSKQTKIENIQKQMAMNDRKIIKLMAINDLLKENLLNLKQEPEKPKPVSEEERLQKSKIDKQKFENFVHSRATDPNNPILRLLEQAKLS